MRDKGETWSLKLRGVNDSHSDETMAGELELTVLKLNLSFFSVGSGFGAIIISLPEGEHR